MRGPRTPGGYLLYGRAFRAKVTALALDGIGAAPERHDAALKMAWYWFVVQRLPVDRALAEVETWLRSRPHAVKPGRAHRWIRKTLVEVRHYLRRLERSGRAPTPRAGRLPIGGLGLGAADDPVLAAVDPEVGAEARALLTYLGTFADGRGRVPHPVDLPRARVEDLCGHRRVVDPDGRRRRAAVCAVEELVRIGVVALHTDYSTGRHGRRYTVWYQFGSGRLPEASPEGLVVGARAVEEGELVAVIAAPGEPPVGRLRRLRAGIADAADTWWRRMYGRRAFTPAEFFDADERRILPGPFRDRVGLRRARAPASVSPAAPVVAPLLCDPPVTVEPLHAWPCVCALCFEPRVAAALSGRPDRRP